MDNPCTALADVWTVQLPTKFRPIRLVSRLGGDCVAVGDPSISFDAWIKLRMGEIELGGMIVALSAWGVLKID